MGAQWFELDATTGAVRGWARSSADAPPAAPAGVQIVAATDADIAQYESLQHQAMASGQSASVTLTNGVLALPPDTRLHVAIATDKAIAHAGVDTITLTVTALNATGATDTTFNQTIYYALPDSRVFSFPFVSGVASRAIPATRSGKFTLRSTKDVRIDTPVEILVVE
jgi:hypothetical protein